MIPIPTWITTGLLTAHDGGVRIRNGAHVSSETTRIASSGNGTVSVVGSESDAVATWENSGDVYVAGDANGASGHSGALVVTGYARAEVEDTLKIWETGSVTVGTASTLVAGRIQNTDGGEFDLTGGTLAADLFEGDLVNREGTLAPGDGEAGTTSIVGNYVQRPDASLAIDIGGTTPGMLHDVLLSGLAQLDGELTLSLIDGFTPDVSDEIHCAHEQQSIWRLRKRASRRATRYCGWRGFVRCELRCCQHLSSEPDDPERFY